MSRPNQGNNNNNRSAAATAATVAGAAAVAYGAYKLFSMFGSNESHENQSNNDSDAFQSHSPPFSFFQKEIYVIDAVEKLRYSIRALQTYVEQIKFQNLCAITK